MIQINCKDLNYLNNLPINKGFALLPALLTFVIRSLGVRHFLQSGISKYIGLSIKWLLERLYLGLPVTRAKLVILRHQLELHAQLLETLVCLVAILSADLEQNRCIHSWGLCNLSDAYHRDSDQLGDAAAHTAGN